MYGAQKSRFEAAKGKIKLRDLWNRQMITVRIRLRGELTNSGPARVGQAKNFGGLIKNFTYSVVARRANNLKMLKIWQINNLCMTTRNHKC